MFGSDIDEFDQGEMVSENIRDKSALFELMAHPFGGKEDLGQSLARYNGARRVDVTSEPGCRVVRSPSRFLTIVKQFEIESLVPPSYGLEVKSGNRKEYVHLLLEINPRSVVGIFYFDTKRTLLVPQVHYTERLINRTNLNGGVIIANYIGVPAKKEAERINSMYGEHGIITIEQYDTIEKRYQASL